MARLLCENRFILTRKLHREYYRERYMRLRFRQLFYLGYRFREWVNYRQLVADHGEAVVNIVRFYPVNVQVQVNETSFWFKYDTISSAFETEELIVLELEREGMAGHVQLLYKNGFREMEEAAFKRFINEKTGREIFAPEDEDGERSGKSG
ncbi:MAG: hypothetical protein IKI75_05065 [Lachnospiraceae bacterium]|nr:hypothetical protein [Lachnospiraceae bacterium]